MTIEVPARVAADIERFTGRSWLVPKIIRWWEGTNDRIFLLTGSVGSGKSTTLAWLAGLGPPPSDPVAAEGLNRLRKAVKAAHFCRSSSRNITPAAFAESVASQLVANRVPGFAEALAATVVTQVQVTAKQTINAIAAGGTATAVAIDVGALGDELSFDRLLIEPLKKLYAGGFCQRMLLVVDSLDEALTYAGVTLPDLLSRLTDLPSPVRILASSRDEPRVLKFFRNVRTCDLIKDAEIDADDVRAYAVNRLTNIVSIDDAYRDAFAKRLSERAGGIFLYAVMVLDELLKCPSDEFPELATYPLPRGLSGLYHDFINRELGKNEDKWFDMFQSLLGLIAVSQGSGFTASQLAAIIGKDVRAALRVSKQYLSGQLPDGPFRLFHKSFADFLLEDKDNLDYHVDAQGMHRQIADHYWLENCANWATSDNYAVCHLPTHLGILQAWPKLAELLLDSSFSRKVSDLSNEALADAYRWAHVCLEHVPDGNRRMLLLQLAVAAEQLRFFVGRAAEIREVGSFLESGRWQHLVVVGHSGIGKTSLMSLVWVRHFDQCLIVKLQAVESLYAALMRVVRDSPWLVDHDPREECKDLIGSGQSYQQLLDRVSRCKMKLCFIIDEAESAGEEVDIEGFVFNLPLNIRIIWASRPIPRFLNRLGATLRLNLHQMQRSEIIDLCHRRLSGGVREELIQRIAYASDGNPLFINVAMQAVQGGVASDEVLEQSSRTLREVRGRHLRDFETTHPTILERLASAVAVMTGSDQTGRVRLGDLANQFDDYELDAMRESGLIELQVTSEGELVSVTLDWVLDFLRQHYPAARRGEAVD